MAADIATIGLEVDSRQVRNAARELENLEKAGKRAETGTESVRNSMARLASVAAGFGVALGIKEFIQYADTQKLIASRLGLVTSSLEERIAVEQRLFSIAQQSRTAYESTAELYSRVARSSKTLGASQEEMLRMTETINKAMTISGASAQSSQAALIQLSQAFASGTLRGEELNSVLEQAPRLAEAIATGMGKTVGELRKLGSEGAITSKALFDSLKNQAAIIDQEFLKMKLTVSQAFIQLDNAIGKAVGGADGAKGATQQLAQAISDLAAFTEQYGAKVIGAFEPAIKIGLAYFGIFKLAPAIFAAMATSINGVSVAAQLANGSLTKMAVAGNVLFAAFAGWQIGTYLREQFVEVRVAGLAMVGALLRGWELNKYASQVAWEAIKAAGMTALNALKGAFAGYLNFVGKGLSLIGAEQVSGQILQYAESLRKAADAGNGFAEAKTKLDANYAKSVAAIDDNITSLVAYELSTGKADKSTVDLSRKLGGGGSGKSGSGLAGAAKQAADKIREVVEALKFEIEQIGRSTELQDYYNQLKQAGISQNNKEAETIRALVEQKHSLNYENDLLIEYTRQQEEEQKKFASSLIETEDALKQELKTLKEQNEAFGLNAVQVADLKVSKLEMALATAESEKAIQGETAAIELQIASLRDQLDLAKQISGETAISEIYKANEEAAKKAKEVWQKTADSIENSLTDALMRGFEGGKDFANNFKDTIKNMFRTLVLRPIISPIMKSLAGGLAGLLPGISEAGGGGLSGLLGGGGGGGLLSTLTQGLGGSVFSGISSGFKMASQAFSQFGFFGGLKESLGLAVSEATNGAFSSAFGAAIPAIGTALGVAGLAYAAFKPGKREETGKGITGTVTSEAFTGVRYDEWTRKGGFLRGSKSGRDSGPLDQQFQEFLDSGLQSLSKSMQEIGKVIGIDAKQMLDTFKMQFDMSISGMSDDQIKQALAGKLGEVGDAMANKLVPGLEAFAKAGETASQTLNRVVANTAVFNQAIGNLGFDVDSMFSNIDPSAYIDRVAANITQAATSAIAKPNAPNNPFANTSPDLIMESDITVNISDMMQQYEQAMQQYSENVANVAVSTDDAAVRAQALAIAVLDMKNQLIEGAGGIEAFTQKTAYFYENFYSEQERQQKAVEAATKTLNEEFSKFGVAVPATRAEFRNLVESQDLTTESGRNLFNMLLNVSDEFVTVTGAAGAVGASVGSLEDASNAVLDAMNSIVEMMNAVSELANSIDDSILGIQKSMKGFDEVAYYAGQVGDLKNQLGSTTDMAARVEIGGKLRDAIMNRYQAESSRLRENQDEQMSALKESQDSRMQALKDQQQAEEENYQQQISNLESIAQGLKSIGDYAQSLLISDLSTLTNKQKLDEAQSQYNNLLSLAQGGDQDAISKIQDVASQYLEQARNYYASSQDYTSIFGSVQGSLAGLGAQGDSYQAQADSMAAQGYVPSSSLEQQIAELQATFDTETAALQAQFDQQNLDLQQAAVDELTALKLTTDEWQAELTESLSDQAILFTQLNLSVEQVAAILSEQTPQIVEAINNAAAAQAAANEEVMKALAKSLSDAVYASGEKVGKSLTAVIEVV